MPVSSKRQTAFLVVALRRNWRRGSDSDMLSSAACGKQDRGDDDGASMPESKRGSGLKQAEDSFGGESLHRNRTKVMTWHSGL
jgi:hypothetical protein